MCSNYLNILNLNGIDDLLWIGLECCVMLCDAHCPTWGGQVVLTWNDSHGYWGSHFLQMEWSMTNAIWWYLMLISKTDWNCRCWRSDWCQIKFQSGGTMLIWRTLHGIKIGASKSGPQQPRGAQSVLRFKPLKKVLRICPILLIILINQKLIIHHYEDNVSNKHVKCDILWCKKWPVQSDWLLLNQITSQWLDGRLDGGNSPNQRT